MSAKPQNMIPEHPPEFPQLCRFLADRSPQPMVAVEGLTHLIRYANPAFRRLLGKEEQHLIGRPFAEAVPEGMANGCAPLLDRVFATGTPEMLAEQEHRPRDGAVQDNGDTPPTHWSYSVWAILGHVEGHVGGAEEKPVGVMIQVTDSTEIARFRKAAAAINEALLVSGVRQHELMDEAETLTAELRRSEADERAAKQEAEAANRSKDLFLATLSHEMRTPLNAIVGWVSILRGDGCNPEDLREGLDVIDRNTQAQVQLIDDVLDVSRIVSGKLRLEVRPCDMAAVLNAGIDVVRPAAQARGIAIDVQLDPAARHASCDPTRIQQIVWNLLSNALKFTPKGGKIGITLSHEHSGLMMRVSDNGQGISPELLPYVFDRFRQADSSTRRKFGGLGLGLSIVKQLVEMHGGTIEAHSDGEGTGATFIVKLPIRAVRIDEDNDEPEEAADESEHAPSAQAGLPLVRLDGLRVLVVDDEADARRLLAKVLEQAGASVTAAGSAREAMQLLPEVNPQLLVSDIGMPDEDGLDLIRQVRKAGHGARDLPAVALTAFVRKEDQRQALLAGFQVHVTKPVDPHDLTVVLASLTGRTGA